MKEFDYSTRDVLAECGLLWRWKNTDPGETALESLALAWKDLVGDTLPSLPEPYDIGNGSLLYFIPPVRFVRVDTKSKISVELYEVMPLYYLRSLVNGAPSGSPRFSERYRNDQAAIYALALQVRREGLDFGFAVYKYEKGIHDHEIIFTWSTPPWI